MKDRNILKSEAEFLVGEMQTDDFLVKHYPVNEEYYKLGYVDGYVIGYEKAIKEDLWIEVDGYKNVPVGDWLFKIQTKKDEIEYHTGHIHSNGYCVIGGHFGFDRDKVIAYKKISE